MDCKLSVIIPCYNCENTLPETLDCVLGQSLHDEIQIITVNDGSTDRTEEIIGRYAASHPEITPVHKENGGVSSARNAGLKAAKGKYVIFLDADDLLTPSSCGELYKAMEKRGADCAVFRLSRFGFGGSEYNPVAEKLAKRDNIPYNDTELLWTFLTGNKCFRRDALLNAAAEFPPLTYGEDGVFWVSFLMKGRPVITGVYSAECKYRREDPAVRASVTQTMKLSLVSDYFTSCSLVLDALDSDELRNEMRLKICRTVTNEFYRRLWQADEPVLDALAQGYGKYFSLLSPQDTSRLFAYDADIGKPVFSRKYAADNPRISVKVKKPSEEFLRSLYSQTMPLFELLTENAGEYSGFENVSSGRAKAPVQLSFSGSEKLDPRLLRAVLLLKMKFPFSVLPSGILKKAASIYLK